MTDDYVYSEVGCGSLLLSYVVGSYLLASIAVIHGIFHWSLALAPIAVPVWFVLLLALIGASETPTDISGLFFFIVVWIVFSLAAFHGLQAWRRRTISLWAFALLATGYVLGVLWELLV